MTDLEAMTRALELARGAEGQTSPNPTVGCVILREGAVLAEGVTGEGRPAWGPHAEASALARLGGRAPGATLYVTLEPCSFVGKSPACTEAILAAGVRRVVVGTVDPNSRVSGRGIERLRQGGIEVEVGVGADACRAFLAPWLHFIQTGRPWVLLKGAMTLDGKVATHTGHSQWITSPEARAEAHRLRAISDGVMVGAGTALADNPSLTVRLAEPRGPALVRVLVDSTLRTPDDAHLLDPALGPTLALVGPRAPEGRAQSLRDRGIDVERIPEGPDGLDLRSGLTLLGGRGLVQLMVEGGPSLAASFVRQGLVNDYQIFVAPRLIGGQGALGLLGGVGVATVEEGPALTFTGVRQIGPDLLISARPIAPPGPERAPSSRGYAP